MAVRQEHEPNQMKQGTGIISLNVVITGLALTLALIAAQSPFM